MSLGTKTWLLSEIRKKLKYTPKSTLTKQQLIDKLVNYDIKYEICGYKVHVLKKQLKMRQLSTTGKREDLIDRLWQDDIKKKENSKEKPDLIVSSVKQNTSPEPSKLKVLDLFCGCGGMSKGLEDAGLKIVAGIDVWNKAIASYKKNFNHLSICKDLRKLSPESFSSQYNVQKTDIDLIVGGPPCQGFSIAGKRNIADPRNSLFMEYVKYLNYFKPKAFIMENVIGILSMKNTVGEKIIDIIMEKLTIDYNCVINKLYASDFEVPQNRRRVIIIGVRKDLKITPKPPQSILSKQDRIPVSTILEAKKDVDIKQFLSKRALSGIKRKKERSKIN